MGANCNDEIGFNRCRECVRCKVLQNQGAVLEF